MHPEKCIRTLVINLNFNDNIDYLLAQRFLNDFWYFTGFIFILTGGYLMILAKNKKATKFIVSTIFGEIFIFTVGCGLFGLKIKYLEWCLFIVGIIIGLFVGYFCLGGNRLFRAILSITGGYIFGLIIFDLIFAHGNYRLAPILLTDTVLVFIGMGVVTIFILPDYHYFYDSIIGSYLFIRGITVLLQKLGKLVRYRELQLMLYLTNKKEMKYAEYYFEKHYPIYYIYTVIILVFMGVSMFYYYSKNVGKDDEDEKYSEEKLIGPSKSTATEDDQDLE